MTSLLAGVAGYPVAHSLSPRLHNYWLAEHGIDGAYVKLPVPRQDFARALDGLRRAGFAGINITIPHKEAAFALAHRYDEAARAAQAANLLVFEEGGTIAAANTDVIGLTESLTAQLGAGFLRGKSAVILGAGGAARAGVQALTALGASRIHILNRHPARAQSLAAALAPHSAAQLQAGLWTEWEQIAPLAALLVNCTSAGMRGQPSLDLNLAPLHPAAAVCDIVYRPLETALLKAARASGHACVDGLGMLMHQAVPSFAAFYGVTPLVTAKLRAHLEGALHAA